MGCAGRVGCLNAGRLVDFLPNSLPAPADLSGSSMTVGRLKPCPRREGHGSARPPKPGVAGSSPAAPARRNPRVCGGFASLGGCRGRVATRRAPHRAPHFRDRRPEHAGLGKFGLSTDRTCAGRSRWCASASRPRGSWGAGEPGPRSGRVVFTAATSACSTRKLTSSSRVDRATYGTRRLVGSLATSRARPSSLGPLNPCSRSTASAVCMHQPIGARHPGGRRQPARIASSSSRCAPRFTSAGGRTSGLNGAQLRVRLCTVLREAKGASLGGRDGRPAVHAFSEPYSCGLGVRGSARSR